MPSAAQTEWKELARTPRHDGASGTAKEVLSTRRRGRCTTGAMCRPVECMVCKKTTWAGCGAHVQQVMGAIPPEKRCTCREETPTSPPTKKP